MDPHWFSSLDWDKEPDPDPDPQDKVALKTTED